MNNPYNKMQEYVGKQLDYKEFCDIMKIEELTRVYKIRQLKSFEPYMDIEIKNKKVTILELYDDELLMLDNDNYHEDTKKKFLVNNYEKHRSGVYIIQDISNNVYIGQTEDFITRFYQHNAKLNGKWDFNKKTKELLDNSGTFKVLCFEDDLEKRLILEAEYVNKYKSNGYNVINNENILYKNNGLGNGVAKKCKNRYIKISKWNYDKAIEILNREGLL